MSHLPFTITAYLFNSISVTVDKFLLTKHIPDPLVYIFYFSTFSLLVLFLLPFTHLPPVAIFALASLSTILWTTGAYFMFKALQAGQVSRVVPVIGTLIPLFLLLEAVSNQTLNLNQVWAVGILTIGLVCLTLPDWKGRITKKEILCEIFSSVLFAASYLILREAYLREQFLSVFVSSRLILIPIGLIIFIVPNLRHRVLNKNGPKIKLFSKTGALFLTGQAAGGSSELLLTFSISLASPALVNSLQGVQYIFLFLFSLILSKKFPTVFKEHLSPNAIFGKVLGILLIGFGLFILSFTNHNNQTELGVSFSPRYATELGLEPQTTYTKMLDELRIKNIRLPLYWDEIEPEENRYNFDDIQFYIDQSQLHQTNLVLVVGQKVPRWPECFLPAWVKKQPVEQQQLQLLQLLYHEVNYYKNQPNLVAWQVENEPLLVFGSCPKPDQNLLEKEVNLVRSIDPNHPILVTGSGELSFWVKEAELGDWFGTTIYRTVWDRLIGYFNYPFPPIYYQLKYDLVKLFAPNNSKAIVAELQAEPWVPAEKKLNELDIAEQAQLFSAKKISQNLEFANQTNFSSVYFWGVEWWYYMQVHGHSEYVDSAKEIFSN